ncbi:unnamed protein product [Gemmata massiliana]|uniref:Uncharacterized protein n=1 Tax=Gemmata massiliana TaxID=1210884 RepID=A0A6P2CW58_9BACT|nr:hypothetical protein [Gemmata massiliana]VTR92626.1 unnamed protein product [Gemmata massiliana]
MSAQMFGELLPNGISILIGICVTLVGFRVFGKKPGVSEEADRWHAKTGKWLKLLGPVIVLGGLVSLVATTNKYWPRTADGWSRHTTTDGACSVEFPHAPEHDVGSEGEENRLVVSLSGRNVNYSLTFSDVPEWTGIPLEEQFNKLREHYMGKSSGSTTPLLLDERVLTENGFPGREYHIAVGHQFVTRIKVFINGSRVYRAIAVNPPDIELDSKSQRFIDSFRFEIRKP